MFCSVAVSIKLMTFLWVLYAWIFQCPIEDVHRKGDCFILSSCPNTTQPLKTVRQQHCENNNLFWALSLWRNQTRAVVHNTHVTARQQWLQYLPCCEVVLSGHLAFHSSQNTLTQMHVCLCLCLYNKYLCAYCNVCRRVCLWSPSAKGALGHLENVHAHVRVCECAHKLTYTVYTNLQSRFYNALTCSSKSSWLNNQPGRFNGLNVTGTDVIGDMRVRSIR